MIMVESCNIYYKVIYIITKREVPGQRAGTASRRAYSSEREVWCINTHSKRKFGSPIILPTSYDNEPFDECRAGRGSEPLTSRFVIIYITSYILHYPLSLIEMIPINRINRSAPQGVRACESHIKSLFFENQVTRGRGSFFCFAKKMPHL